jgi:hypothetical protein
MSTTTILRPGYLVSLKTAIRGGIAYERAALDAPAPDAPEAEVTRWETTRTIADRAEHAWAVETRSKAVGVIRRVCLATSFGLLCPIVRESELDAAIDEARGIADAFNASAQHSRIDVYVLRGRIAETDEESTRAIADEVRGLLDEMDAGVRSLDVASVRDAARRARELAQALDDRSADKMGTAIDAARTAARAIVRRVEKGGEAAADVLRELNLGAIASARFAFLDLADAGPAQPALPAVELGRFAGLDLSEDPYRPTLPVAAAPRGLEV